MAQTSRHTPWFPGRVGILFTFIALPTILVGCWILTSVVHELGASFVVTALVGSLGLSVGAVAELVRYARRGARERTWLSPTTHIMARTLIVHVVLILTSFVVFPQTLFTSLAMHGDWMFRTEDDVPSSPLAQRSLYTIVDGLEWVHEWAFEDHERERVWQLEQTTHRDTPLAPRHTSIIQGRDVVPPSSLGQTRDHDNKGAPRRLSTPRQRFERYHTRASQPPARWTNNIPPSALRASPHPIIMTMTPADSESIESVAHYISQRVQDPFERIKAIHDWVALHITYDTETYNILEGRREGFARSQAPADVFAARTGVCAGYARLVARLGELTGDEIVVLNGKTVNQDKTLSKHVWNAAKIRGHWYLLDATWDDPGDNYRTSYLFADPLIFIHTHFPNHISWQLLEDPVSLAQFIRGDFTPVPPSAARSTSVKERRKKRVREQTRHRGLDEMSGSSESVFIPPKNPTSDKVDAANVFIDPTRQAPPAPRGTLGAPAEITP